MIRCEIANHCFGEWRYRFAKKGTLKLFLSWTFLQIYMNNEWFWNNQNYRYYQKE